MKNNLYYSRKAELIAQSILIIILILIIIPTTTLNAQETSKEQAEIIAEQFLLSQKVQNKSYIQQSDTNPIFKLQKLYQSSNSVKNTLHCFQNEEGGFVFVLENSGIFFVVGYSYKGRIIFLMLLML